MKMHIKMKRLPAVLSGNHKMQVKKETGSLIFLILFLSVIGLSCSKSSTSAPTPAPTTTTACTTDSCKLTSLKWEIVSQHIITDLGEYTYSATQLATINWATFLFKTDLTYMTYGGEKSNYVYIDSTKTLVLIDNLLPLHFNVAFPKSSTLALTGIKIQMHPRTDSSVEANFAFNTFTTALYNDFGVDTSKIHFIQAVFTYDGF
jgi:hypothetical protein